MVEMGRRKTRYLELVCLLASIVFTPAHSTGKNEMTNWSLEDVSQTARKNPSTFFIPSAAERQSQKKGDVVRLHFVLRETGGDLPQAERMWVEVLENRNDGEYTGILTNQPVYIKNLSAGDTITFQARHIARTVIKKNDPRWIDCSEKNALVSAKCLENGGVVRFLYREEPDRAEDSGWRVFSGQESDEYSNDPRNIQLVSVGYLVDLDPTLHEVFKSGKSGDAFERAEKGKKWVRVKDWKPEE